MGEVEGSQLKFALYDPFGLKHLEGLRKRLFRVFNEFSTVLRNALLPPVSKTKKKIYVKIEKYDLKADYLADLNLLLLEVKKESKNEYLHCKKNKNYLALRKQFQTNLIQCYKLAIKTTEICSKTLRTGTYHPVQSKMKNLLQTISSLSFNAGKYIYGEKFKVKKKEKENSDLVRHCEDLESMLNGCGYNDDDHEDHSVNTFTADELVNKSLTDTRNKIIANNRDRLSMYEPHTPNVGTRTVKKIKKIKKKIHQQNRTDNSDLSGRKTPLPLKIDQILNLDSLTIYNDMDDVKTAIEEHPMDQNDRLFPKETKTVNRICDDKTSLPSAKSCESIDSTTTRTIAYPANVAEIDVVHDPWKKFPMKGARVSTDGNLLLNVSHEVAEEVCEYRRQYKQQCLRPESQEDVIFKITERLMEDLFNEVFSDTHTVLDKIVEELIIEESKWLELYKMFLKKRKPR